VNGELHITFTLRNQSLISLVFFLTVTQNVALAKKMAKPIAIDSLQTVFALYDLIEQAETDGTKVNNYALAKQICIDVEQRNTEEEWDVAYKRRVVSVAVSRKKKVAVDAISNVVKRVFPC